MRAVITLLPIDSNHSCDLLEGLAEGIVLANMIEIGADDDDVFPCCIKCGGFKIMLDRHEVDCARSLLQRGGGNPLALVCYQVAKDRLENDSRADVVIEQVERNGVVVPGEYRPLVRKANIDTGADEFSDPLDGLETAGNCGCGVAPP